MTTLPLCALNPYWGKTGGQFLVLALQRLLLFFSGQVDEFAADEIQLLALALCAATCGVVGSFLVLKKMAMLANSLAHTVLCGIVAAYALEKLMGGGAFLDGAMPLGAMLLASCATAVITAWATELTSKVLRLQEDASIGLVFSALFALGVLGVSAIGRHVHIGLEVIMGNADALQSADLFPIFLCFIINIALCALFFRPYQLTAFDPFFAASSGVRSGRYHYLLMLQTALTLIGAFRAVGAFLAIAFISGLPLLARLFCRSLMQMLFFSAAFGIGLSLWSVGLGRHLLTTQQIALSTGGLAVASLVAVYVLAVLGQFFFRKRRQGVLLREKEIIQDES